MENINLKQILADESSIVDQATMFSTSMALRCAVQLGIPDIVSSPDTPVTKSELISKLSVPQSKSSHFYRLMSLLACHGVFAVQKDGHGEDGYVSTSVSKALSRKSPGNFSNMVLLMTDPCLITPGLAMAEWFQNSSTNRSPFEGVYGMTMYEYYNLHPEMNTQFNEAMGSSTKYMLEAVIEQLKPKLEGFETLVDVGGGNGTVAKAIAQAAPHLKLTVLDQPHVVSNVKDTNGITFIGGDMFEFVPSADVIHIKGVLMDWGNADVLKVLTRCREAFSREDHSGGKVIIVDGVVDATITDSETLKAQSRLDIFTSISTAGKLERTETEWNEMFVAAGFTSYKITPTFPRHSIIEVFP